MSALQKARERENPSGASAHTVRTMRLLPVWLLACAVVAMRTPPSFAAVVTVTDFAAGTLPDDIIQVLGGYGSLGGSYLVTNPIVNFTGTGVIYTIPAGGGSPAIFANVNPLLPIGGIFLLANYGPLAGQFLAAGRSGGSSGPGDVIALTSTGARTPIRKISRAASLARSASHRWGSIQ